MNDFRAIDLFCGVGGSSLGAKCAGFDIVAGFDKWELVGKVYKDNFPDALFFSDPIESINCDEISDQVGKIDLILASPECTNHSPAKGNRPRCEKSKKTAFEVIRFAKVLSPKWIVIENVVSMRYWDGYGKLVKSLKNLGYFITEQVIDSSEFGVPQKRRRIFLICSAISKIDQIKPSSNKVRLASHIVDMNGTYNMSPLFNGKRAEATLERAQRAISKIDENEPFLLVYYGSDYAGGWQRLDRPLRTITTIDRFALVKPTQDCYVMRMLQVPELQLAMGFPKKYRMNFGTRRDRIKMVGNAVCPPVMKRIVKQLKKQQIPKSDE